MSRRIRSRHQGSKVVASSTAAGTQLVEGRRLELHEVVSQLTSRFVDDMPVDHVCPPNPCAHGPLPSTVRHPDHICVRGCSHKPLATMPLLARLQMLVLKGSAAPRADAGSKGGKKTPAGSPAPWSAQPAELLDEIARGAVAMAAQARVVAGFSATPRRDSRGHAALWDMLRLLTFLQSRPDLREHPLASAPPVRVGHPRRPGALEQQLRSWHRQALLLTGHEQPWPKLGQVALPDERPQRAGPVCRDRDCWHQSCRAIRYTAPTFKWVQSRCPHCGSASLKQEPVSGDIVCLRPSCVDPDGYRHAWTPQELERLGLILTQEAAS